MTAAKAYECSDGTLLLLFDNPFALSLAETSKDAIIAAVMSVTDKYTAQTVKLDLADIKSDYVLIDEVIEAANEDNNGGNNEG